MPDVLTRERDHPRRRRLDPSTRSTAFDECCRTQTIGANAFERASIGTASAIASTSAFCSATAFGTSSPSVDAEVREDREGDAGSVQQQQLHAGPRGDGHQRRPAELPRRSAEPPPQAARAQGRHPGHGVQGRHRRHPRFAVVQAGEGARFHGAEVLYPTSSPAIPTFITKEELARRAPTSSSSACRIPRIARWSSRLRVDVVDLWGVLPKSVTAPRAAERHLPREADHFAHIRVRHPDHFEVGERTPSSTTSATSRRASASASTRTSPPGCRVAGGVARTFRLGDFCSLSSGVKIWCTSDDFVNDVVTIMPAGLEVKEHLIDRRRDVRAMHGGRLEQRGDARQRHPRGHRDRRAELRAGPASTSSRGRSTPACRSGASAPRNRDSGPGAGRHASNAQPATNRDDDDVKKIPWWDPQIRAAESATSSKRCSRATTSTKGTSPSASSGESPSSSAQARRRHHERHDGDLPGARGRRRRPRRRSHRPRRDLHRDRQRGDAGRRDAGARRHRPAYAEHRSAPRSKRDHAAHDRPSCPCTSAAAARTWRRICEVARQHGIVVIEDAAEALRVAARGRCLGTFGDARLLLVLAEQDHHSGQGGMIVTDDDAARAAALRELKDQGRPCAAPAATTCIRRSASTSSSPTCRPRSAWPARVAATRASSGWRIYRLYREGPRRRDRASRLPRFDVEGGECPQWVDVVARRSRRARGRTWPRSRRGLPAVLVSAAHAGALSPAGRRASRTHVASTQRALWLPSAFHADG